MMNPPPIKDAVIDDLSISQVTGSANKKYVGRHHHVFKHGEKVGRKPTIKKGGILPSTTEIFGCEHEKTDLRNGSREFYFDRKENCLHGDISVIALVTT